jgi:hypothetical protein
MAESSNRTLNVFINTGEAQKSYDALIAKEKTLNKQLAETSDPKRMQKLNQELAKLQEPISRAAKKMSGELAPSVREVDKTVKALGNQLLHMSKTDADFSKVLAQYRQAQVELKQLRAEAGNVGKAFEETKNLNPFGRILEFAKGTLLAGGIAGILSSFSGLIRGSIEQALDADEATQRFKSTLDNLGRSDAFDRIIKKADQIASRFKYLDNDDVVGVFNKLVDYGKLTEGQMNELLPVIVDFAAKTRTSIGDSADTIIKALEGNGKAVKQFGVALNANGTAAENLQEVMTTLKSKVDGAGDAFQNSAAGGIKTAQQSFDDLKENIGTGLLPMLNTVLGVVNKVVKGLNGITRASEEEAEMQTRLDTVTVNLRIKQYEKLIAQGKFTKEQLLKELETRVANNTISKTDQGVLLKLSTKVLGIDGSKDKPTKDTAKDKALSDYKQLMELLRKMQQDVALMNLSDRDKELQQLETKYQDLRTQAKGHKDALLLIEKLYHDEHEQLLIKYAKQDADEETKRLQKDTDDREAFMKQDLENQLKFAQDLAKRIQDARKKDSDNTLAGVQLDIKQSSPYSKNRLELQQKLLKLEMQRELDNKDLTEKQKLLIEQTYKDKAKDLNQQYWLGID